MRKAHLAILPTPEGRRAERRIVNLAASLREPGASLNDIEVVNLSVTGFAAESDAALEIGAQVWLKLPGIEPTACRVVRIDGRTAGFEFVTPLHAQTLDTLTAGTARPPVKRHFGVGGGTSHGMGGLRSR